MSRALTTVALIGVRGYGRHYLEPLAADAAAGRLRFVGGCDIQPEAEADLPDGVPFFTDHRAMLDRVRPDVAIVATPPHTHFPISCDVIRAGSDLMLEKPPVVSVDEHRQLAELCRTSGRVCQVGFQGLVGSPVRKLVEIIRDGSLGAAGDITVTGQWIRLDRYYDRSPWAGHRHLNGVVVADGAATNPLAHPVMNALAAAAAGDSGVVPVRLDVEAYRCRDIGTDDTVSARIHLSDGRRIVLALTLCAEEHVDPVVTVDGDQAVAELANTATALALAGERLDLPADRGRPLDNLLAHRLDPDGVALLGSLERTAPYTAFLDGMLRSGEPRRIPDEVLRSWPEEGTRRVVIPGINDLIAEAGRRGALFSELGVEWAEPPVSVALATG